MKRNLAWATAVALLLSFGPLQASTDKYRAMWRDTPATTMVIGWNQISGSAPKIHYDTVDHGTNPAAYAFNRAPDRSVSAKGMSNQYARLTGLTPNTLYYFVIADSNSTSARMMFRTAPNDDTPFTVIAGGDSRNNTSVRIAANKMVAKLKPLVVLFGGDMTESDSNSEWQAWMDHWQYTKTAEGRLIPILATRGNHELSNASIADLFDTPTASAYYALGFGNNLLRTYTLNSEDVEGGNQASWLGSDLAANGAATWKFAQYHKPMRPHNSGKSEGDAEYAAWAQLFYNHRVNLVVECDSHVVKTTYPLRPTTASGNVQGFVRDDANGTIYVGEGTWGAPLRSADDAKSWTREYGSFNQFKWIYVTRSQVTFKTIKYENVDSVGTVNESSPYTPPSGLQTWGTTITLNASASAPTINLTSPTQGQVFNAGATVSLAATASAPGSSVLSVAFYVDGNLIATDTSSPYSTSWTASGNGTHTIGATVSAANGTTASASAAITVGTSSWVTLASDDFESGYGIYIDGGTDCIRNSNNFSFAHQGTYCILIRDDTSTSNFTSNPLNLSSYNQLKIDFWYIANSMETGEDFFVEFYDGSSWQVVGQYISGTNLTNGVFANPSITVSRQNTTFNSSNRVRFRCDASSDTDYIYVDQVVLSVQ